MKKTLSFICAVALIFCIAMMAGCVGSKSQNEENEETESEQVSENKNTNYAENSGAATPEDAAKQYIKAHYEYDVEKYILSMSQYAKNMKVDCDDSELATDKDVSKYLTETWKDREPDKVIDLKVVSINKKSTDEELKDIQKDYDDFCKNSGDVITGYASIELEGTVDFGEDEYSDVGPIYVFCVQINGKWYIEYDVS